MGSTEVCGISAAKLATVVRIRLTPADRAERTGSPMYAACKRAGRFWSTSAMTPWIFCKALALGFVLYSL